MTDQPPGKAYWREDGKAYWRRGRKPKVRYKKRRKRTKAEKLDIAKTKRATEAQKAREERALLRPLRFITRWDNLMPIAADPDNWKIPKKWSPPEMTPEEEGLIEHQRAQEAAEQMFAAAKSDALNRLDQIAREKKMMLMQCGNCHHDGHPVYGLFVQGATEPRHRYALLVCRRDDHGRALEMLPIELSPAAISYYPRPPRADIIGEPLFKRRNS